MQMQILSYAGYSYDCVIGSIGAPLLQQHLLSLLGKEIFSSAATTSLPLPGYSGYSDYDD